MKGKWNLEKMMNDKQSVLKGIITLPTLKYLNNSRKFDDLLDQKKGLEILIKYINFRLIKTQILANIIKPLNKYYPYYNIITYYRQ